MTTAPTTEYTWWQLLLAAVICAAMLGVAVLLEREQHRASERAKGTERETPASGSSR
jgi:putative exporter of polyketide antibiotics